jgi:hypothetical protein
MERRKRDAERTVIKQARYPRYTRERVVVPCSKGCGRTTECDTSNVARAICGECSLARGRATAATARARRVAQRKAREEALEVARAIAGSDKPLVARECACGATYAASPKASKTRQCPACALRAHMAMDREAHRLARAEAGVVPKLYVGTCPCGETFRAKLVNGAPSRTVCAACALDAGLPMTSEERRMAERARLYRWANSLPLPRGACLFCEAPCRGWYCSSTHRDKAANILLSQYGQRATVLDAMEHGNLPETVFDPEAGGARGKGAYRRLKPNADHAGWTALACVLPAAVVLLLAVALHQQRQGT